MSFWAAFWARLGPQIIQLRAQRAVWPTAAVGGADPGDYHVINRAQLMLMVAKRFADDAFQAVAFDRLLAHPPRHRQPDARMLQSVGSDMDSETRPVQPPFVIENRAELLAVHQPQATTEARRCRDGRGRLKRPVLRQPVGSNSQALKRARRLARRALITARPARVRIRSRKPWVRLRFSTLGWKVRFMASVSWRACTAAKGKRNLPGLPKNSKGRYGFTTFDAGALDEEGAVIASHGCEAVRCYR